MNCFVVLIFLHIIVVENCRKNMAGTKTNWEISKEEEKGQIETHAKIVALFNPSSLWRYRYEK